MKYLMAPMWFARFLEKDATCVRQGQSDAGLAQLQQGITAYRATGAEVAQASHLVYLAEAYGVGGQPEAGLAALAEAQALVDATDDRWREAEGSRLRGELLMQFEGQAQQATRRSPQADEAEAWWWHALRVARGQEAKALELRAAMRLSRLWQQQGKCAEAYALLAPIYDWFTEGFDTADLQEAKALLEELGE